MKYKICNFKLLTGKFNFYLSTLTLRNLYFKTLPWAANLKNDKTKSAMKMEGFQKTGDLEQFSEATLLVWATEGFSSTNRFRWLKI